jgi:hypothetical protein
MKASWKIAGYTLAVGASLLAAGCAADAVPTDTGNESLIGSTRTMLYENVVAVGQQVVFFQAGPNDTVELGSSRRGTSAPLTLVGDDPVKGPIRAAEALVHAGGKAFTIVTRSLTPSGPKSYEIIETDGTPAGTSRRPVARTGELLGCGDRVYVAGMRVEANGELTSKPKLEPGFGGTEGEHCLDGSYVFGTDRQDPAARRYYRWEAGGSLALLREDTTFSTYLAASSAAQDEPVFIGDRFFRSSEEIYPGPHPRLSNQWNAWMHGFRPMGVVKNPAGEARLVFTDFDLSEVVPRGSGWTSHFGPSCLWITDGTVAGTQMVEGSCAANANQPTSGTFTTNEGLLVGFGLSLRNFWTSDGTVAGTRFHSPAGAPDVSVLSVTRTSDGRAALVTRNTTRSATGSYDVTLWTVNTDGTNLVAAAPPKFNADVYVRAKLISFDGGVAFSMRDKDHVIRLYPTEL